MDHFFRFFLSFSHPTVIVPLVVVGYIGLSEKKFYQALSLLFLSMLVNCALKASFKIPLSPTLGKEGFAFPSGHMQSSIVFYGWLFKFCHKYIKIALSFILVCIAGGLLHFQYHNSIDIAGGIFFGCMLIFLYNTYLKQDTKKTFYICAILSSFILLYIHYIYKLRLHVWMVYFALIGFMISHSLFKHHTLTFKQKVFAIILCLSLLIGLHYLFCILPFLMYFKWMCMAFTIPLCPYLIDKIYLKIQR